MVGQRTTRLAARFEEIDELRRRENRGQTNADGFLEFRAEFQLLLNELDERINFSSCHWAAKGAREETREDLAGIRDVLRRVFIFEQERCMALRRPLLVQRPFNFNPI